MGKIEWLLFLQCFSIYLGSSSLKKSWTDQKKKVVQLLSALKRKINLRGGIYLYIGLAKIIFFNRNLLQRDLLWDDGEIKPVIKWVYEAERKKWYNNNKNSSSSRLVII